MDVERKTVHFTCAASVAVGIEVNLRTKADRRIVFEATGDGGSSTLRLTQREALLIAATLQEFAQLKLLSLSEKGDGR